jgi:hypothetical protein
MCGFVVGLLPGGPSPPLTRPHRPLLIAVVGCAAPARSTLMLALGAPVVLIVLAAAAAGLGAVVFNTLGGDNAPAAGAGLVPAAGQLA